MNVDLEVQTVQHFPAIEGPHELAWAYILDAVFADAHLARLKSLFLVVPSIDLVSEVQLRAELTTDYENATGAGMANLTGAKGNQPSTATRVYDLRFGLLAPRIWRRTGHVPGGGATLHSVYSIYTWKVLVWGVPIHLANRAQRPDIADRALYAMRRDFVGGRITPSYYRLSTWIS